MNTLLVVSNQAGDYQAIRACFSKDVRIDKAANKKDALRLITKSRYDCIFIDIKLLKPREPGCDLKQEIGDYRRPFPTSEIVLITPNTMIKQAVAAVRAGAYYYMPRPINAHEVKYITESIHDYLITQSEVKYLRNQVLLEDSHTLFHTQSEVMKKLYEKLASVALTKSTVLLTGETGTGKGVMAKTIHRRSNRRDAQYIAVHCGAIPDTLLESELFGHEKGAFTGAVKRKLGKFEIARGGTIFLDEIGTLTASAQIKLLQVIQDGIMQRVGGEETIETNVRIIAATNIDLKKASDDGFFRKDLYYRLNVFPVEIPPLRQRREDIGLLAEFFLNHLNRHYTKSIERIHPQVLKAFDGYDWPGNIRELENLMERAYILETSDELTPESFPAELFELEPAKAFPISALTTLAEARRCGMLEIERCYLKEILKQHAGRINESARTAGISTRQLHKILKKHDIHKEEFKIRT